MKALLLIAMLQAPQVDTVRAEMVLPIPVQMVTVGDTTVVDVSVEVGTDSLAALAERFMLAQQARDAAIAACGCAEGGTPSWVYAWGLGIVTVAVLAYTFKEVEETTIYVEQSQEQGQDQATTTTTTVHFPWRRPKKKHGGDDG